MSHGQLSRNALICLYGSQQTQTSIHLKDELETATQTALAEIEQHLGRSISLREPDVAGDATQAEIVVELADELPIGIDLPATAVQTSQVVNWAYQKLAQACSTPPTVSLGTAERLAIADLAERGKTPITVASCGDLNASRIDEAFATTGGFLVVLSVHGDPHRYQVTTHGDTTPTDTTRPIHTNPPAAPPDPLPASPAETAPATADNTTDTPTATPDPLPAPPAAPPPTSTGTPPPPPTDPSPTPPAPTPQTTGPAPATQRLEARVEVVYGERPADTLARWIITCLICVLALVCWVVLTFIEWGIAAQLVEASKDPIEGPDGGKWAIWGGALVVWAATTIGIVVSAVGSYRGLTTRWGRSMPSMRG